MLTFTPGTGVNLNMMSLKTNKQVSCMCTLRKTIYCQTFFSYQRSYTVLTLCLSNSSAARRSSAIACCRAGDVSIVCCRAGDVDLIRYVRDINMLINIGKKNDLRTWASCKRRHGDTSDFFACCRCCCASWSGWHRRSRLGVESFASYHAISSF
jgi:hypothetical protein